MTIPDEAVQAALTKWFELPSTGDASSQKRDMRAALTAALPYLTGVKALEEAARNACMYLETGFIECPKCGEEVETKHTDAEYTLRSALSSQPVADGWLPIETAERAKGLAVSLRQSSIFVASDVGKHIAKSMTDAAEFLEALPVSPEVVANDRH